MTRDGERQGALLLRLEKRHGLDAVAVGIADEGGVITFPVLWPQARRPVRRTSGGKRCGMEGIDQVDRAYAQRRVGAAIGLDGYHGRSQVEPKFRIALAEAEGARANDELFVTDRAQHRLIETRRAVEIANCNGDMVDHLGKPPRLARS